MGRGRFEEGKIQSIGRGAMTSGGEVLKRNEAHTGVLDITPLPQMYLKIPMLMMPTRFQTIQSQR